ncbi:hypothetical protein [Micrococcus sp.]|uniref:hypothetical protein n=1 Tax=Micrococcus sp. TaxID=1271 RepID=UPI002A913A2E|nr:hypothetical protein [Micrococcus sp.]MDY6054681.1 hypothetical protein [Micrococcus sp.]
MTDQNPQNPADPAAGSTAAAPAAPAVETPAAQPAADGAPAAAETRRNGALDALIAYPAAFLTVLKNRPLDALRLGHAQGNGWWLQLLLRNVLAALFLVVLIGRTNGTFVSSADRLFGFRSSRYWYLPFEYGLQLFLLALVLFFLIDLVRVSTLHLSFLVSKSGVPFSASGQIVATAYSGLACITLVGILALLLPGRGLIGPIVLVGLFLVAVFSLAAELLMYIGVNRRHRFTGSPLIPFVAGFAGWILGVCLVTYVFMSVLEGMVN